MNIVAALKNEQAQLAKKLAGVAAAIAVLSGRQTKTRRMSKAARAKISATQKARCREVTTKSRVTYT
jgi:hypothetical protein